MGTRSRIAMEMNDGSIKSVYCHWDGYPSHNGKILLKNYKKSEKVEALLELGNISSLNEEIGTKHNFDSERPVGETTFYGRDRGEKDQEASIDENEEKFWDAVQEDWCEYFYLFRSGKWFYSEGCEKRKFKKLTNKICEKD
jgi:hypothetical protein